MKIVFDLDNTLTDDCGRLIRPGIKDLLDRLIDDGHELILWSNSSGNRGWQIIHDHKLSSYFKRKIFREDYDPDSQDLRKDLRFAQADFLVDDSPEEIAFAKSIKKGYFQISPFHRGRWPAVKELNKLYKAISSQNSLLKRLWKQI